MTLFVATCAAIARPVTSPSFVSSLVSSAIAHPLDRSWCAARDSTPAATLIPHAAAADMECVTRATSSPALAAGLGALGAVVYLVGGRTAQAALLVGFAAAAAAALAVGVRRHRPQHPLPWLLLAACQGCWAVGWALWQLHVLRHGVAPAPGSPADAVFLLGNAAQVGALAFLVGRRGRRSGALLDTSILAVAIGVIAWALLIGPYAGSDGLPTAARLTQILYAAGDVAVLALTLRLALWRPARQPALELVALAMAACLIADARWNWLTLAGGYQAGTWTDLGWLAYAALVGAAGLHPSIARGAGTEDSRPSLSRLGAALLGVAAVTPLAVIGGELAHGRASWAVVGAGGVLCGLVVLRLLGVVRRVEQLSARVRAADARFRNLVEQLPLVTYIDAVDDSASNLYTSPQTEMLLGYTPTEWADDPHMFERLLHPEDRARVLALVEHCNRTGERFLAEFRLIARDGREVWVRDESVIIYDEHGEALHAQGYMFDITARRRAEDELAHRAYHDPLTGLPNRLLFEQRLDEAIAGSGEEAGVAVLYADLDEFKLVNDSSATPPATRCCSRWPSGSAAPPATASSRARAATSSSSWCARRWPGSRPRRAAWPRPRATRCSGRSRWPASRCTPAPASASALPPRRGQRRGAAQARRRGHVRRQARRP